MLLFGQILAAHFGCPGTFSSLKQGVALVNKLVSNSFKGKFSTKELISQNMMKNNPY